MLQLTEKTSAAFNRLDMAVEKVTEKLQHYHHGRET